MGRDAAHPLFWYQARRLALQYVARGHTPLLAQLTGLTLEGGTGLAGGARRCRQCSRVLLVALPRELPPDILAGLQPRPARTSNSRAWRSSVSGFGSDLGWCRASPTSGNGCIVTRPVHIHLSNSKGLVKQHDHTIAISCSEADCDRLQTCRAHACTGAFKVHQSNSLACTIIQNRAGNA